MGCWIALHEQQNGTLKHVQEKKTFAILFTVCIEKKTFFDSRYKSYKKTQSLKIPDNTVQHK
jgi:hypothetical protein